MMGLNRLKDLDPRAVVVHFSATALVFAVASFFVFPLEAYKEAFDATHLAELVAVGVTAAIGQYFLTKAFTAGDPARVSVASLSQFVFILLLDVFVLNNPLDPMQALGHPAHPRPDGLADVAAYQDVGARACHGYGPGPCEPDGGRRDKLGNSYRFCRC